MANALPLLLGAAAVFMLMGKKGGAATPASVVLVESGDTKAEVEGHFDPAVHDRLCAVLALIDGFSASQVATVVGEAAIKYPKTLFIVVADDSAVEQLAAWQGQSFGGAALPSGTVLAVAGKNLGDESGTPVGQLAVTAANAKAKILAVIDLALASNQGASPGQRGLASVGPATSSATSGLRGGLASSAPSQGQSSGGLLGNLASSARQRRVRR